MQVKYFVDSAGQVHGIDFNGSQDWIIKEDWSPINESEVQPLVDAQQQAEFDKNDYYRKRLYSYPELGEFVDAWVKGDDSALEEYRQKCLAVKAQFPKPPGF
jgi:hypothetical protein